MNVSPLVVVLPVSDTLTPEILVATFCATVAFAGAPIDGAPLTVTAIEAGPADPPLLSEALTEITSDPVVPSASASVVRSAFTCDREPAIVSVLPPLGGVIVPPPPAAPVFADSTPALSDSVTVNVSPAVVGNSAMLTPAIAAAWPTPIVAVAGAPTAS